MSVVRMNGFEYFDLGSSPIMDIMNELGKRDEVVRYRAAWVSSIRLNLDLGTIEQLEEMFGVPPCTPSRDTMLTQRQTLAFVDEAGGIDLDGLDAMGIVRMRFGKEVEAAIDETIRAAVIIGHAADSTGEQAVPAYLPVGIAVAPGTIFNHRTDIFDPVESDCLVGG